MSEKFFDACGYMTGYMESDGSIYDGTCTYKGSARDGKLYDACGYYVGRIDSDGRMYDQCDTYKGTIDMRGRAFDAVGNIVGSTQDSGGNPGRTFW